MCNASDRGLPEQCRALPFFGLLAEWTVSSKVKKSIQWYPALSKWFVYYCQVKSCALLRDTTPSDLRPKRLSYVGEWK